MPFDKPKKEKKIESIRAHMGETLYLDISRAAEAQGLTQSAYVTKVLALHMYGHKVMARLERRTGPDSAEVCQIFGEGE